VSNVAIRIQGARVPKEMSGEKPSGPRQKRRLWVAIGLAAGMTVVVAVLLTVLLWPDGEKGRSGSNDGSGDVTQVTSPYDLHEASAETGPSDVKSASLVSISLTAKDGKSNYYGLSANTVAAKALIKAVSGADEVGAAEVVTTTTAPGTAPVSTTSALSSLTFLFPDRSTLAFDLYVEQGIVGRSGHFWRVDGDLVALIEAAVSSRQQQ
jgi:hypothetical protein